ncbi:MAG: zinc-ribbon domain-containing protein, partial [Phycisphaerales bacterium]
MTKGSGRRVWWKCAAGEDHEWQTRVYKRAELGRGCLICTNQLAVESNSLATTHPEIAALWHPTKNGELTPSDVTYGTGRRVWFKCEKGDDHEWQTVPKSLVHGTHCAVCAGKRIVLSNCLATTHPEMAA